MGVNEDLIIKIQNGDHDCEVELIKNNEALVYKIVSEFYYLCNNKEVKEELVQAGNLGLIKAMKGFNIKFGTKFSTYAYKFIKGEILRIVESELNRDLTFTDCFYQESPDVELCHEDIADYISNLMGDNYEKSSEDTACNNIFSKEVLDKLSDRQRKIIVLRYFDDRTQMEIGNILGLHQVEVSREEKRARKILLSLIKENVNC